jgi:hypothetical protein
MCISYVLEDGYPLRTCRPVADRTDTVAAELLRALAYYYDHREAFAEQEQADTSARRAGEQRVQEQIARVSASERSVDPL